MGDPLETIKKLKGGKVEVKSNNTKDGPKTPSFKPYDPASYDVPTKEQIENPTIYDFSKARIVPEKNKIRHVDPNYRTIVTDKPLTDEQVKGLDNMFDEIEQEKIAQETSQDVIEDATPLEFSVGEKVYNTVKSSTAEIIDGLKQIYAPKTKREDLSPPTVIDNLVQGNQKLFTGSLGVVTGLSFTPIEEIVRKTPYVGKPAVQLAQNVFQMIGETGQFPMEVALQTIEQTTGKPISQENRDAMLKTADALTQLFVGERVHGYIKEKPLKNAIKDIEDRVASIYADELVKTKWNEGIQGDVLKTPQDQAILEPDIPVDNVINIPIDRRRKATLNEDIINQALDETKNPIDIQNVDKRDIIEGYITDAEIKRRAQETEQQAINNLIQGQPYNKTNITREMIEAEVNRLNSEKPKPTFNKEQIFEEPIPSGELKLTDNPNSSIPYDRDPVTSAFNLEKINTLGDVHEWFDYAEQNYKAEFNEQRRGRMTQETIKDAGDKMATKISKTISTPPGTVLNPETTYAMRQVMTKGAQELTDYAKTLPSEMTYEQMQGFKERLFKFIAMSKSVSGMRSEAGRLLNQWKIPVDGEIAVMQLLSKELQRLDINDPNILDAVNSKVTPGVWDKAYYIYYNTILASPFTDIANIMGNSTNFGFNLLAGMVFNPRAIPNIVRSISRKIVESKKDIRDIHMGDKFEQSKFLEGGRKTWQSYDLPTNNVVQRWLRTSMPITRLKMEDNFFRKLFEGLETGIQGTKIARKEKVNFEKVYEGLQVPELEIRKQMLEGKNPAENLKVKEELEAVNERLKSILKDPEYTNVRSKNYKDILEGILRFAEYGVFQTPLKSRLGYALQNPGEHWWAPPLKVIMPFVKTPANIIKVGLDATPLGFTRLLGKEAKNLTSMERGQIIRRAVVGSVFTTLIMKMVGDGIIQITGNGPQKREQQDLLLNTGWRPNSVIINKPDGSRTAFSYQNINPFNIPFGIIGNLSDGIKYGKLEDKEDTIEQTLTKGMFNMAYTLTDMSMLKSINTLMRAMDPNNPNENYFTDIAENTVAQPFAVPKTSYDYYRSLFGDEETAKLRYKTDNLFEQFKSRIGLSTGLIPEYDVFGKQKRSTYERFPIPKEYRENQLAEWLLEKKYLIGYPDKKIQYKNEVRELSDLEYADYVNESGKDIWDKLVTEFTKLQDMDDKKAKKRIDDIVSEARENAKKKFKPQKRNPIIVP